MADAPLILTFPEYHEQARLLAQASGLDYAEVKLHYFPDGECKLVLPEQLPNKVIFCRSLHEPNNKLVELILAVGSARGRGVDKVILVAPYLCYMRQDKAFTAGEVVSQHIIGHLLADLFDAVLTVDAHLHRIEHLEQAIPIPLAINLTATQPMAAFLATELDNPLLLGPDSESRQWVAAIADSANLDYVVASKERFGDRDVRVTLPATTYQRRNVVLVDDVASTGKTLLAVAEQLQTHQPASVSVLVDHALFVNDSIEQLRQAGVDNIWSCDSIPHSTNRISLAQMLSQSLKEILSS